MTTSQNICPICGEGHLQARTGKNTVEYKGQSTELDMFYTECDACGSEQANATQLRANKRAMVAFKKQVDGLLSCVEVRALRERLGVNQAEAARIFGGGPVAFSKYESDDVTQSEAMDKLLRVAGAVPSAFSHLVHEAGIEHHYATGDWIKVEIKLTQIKRPALRVISSSKLESEQDWKKTG